MLLKGVFSKHGIITVVSLKQPSFKSALSRAATGNGKGGDHYFLIISVSIIPLLSLTGGGSIFSVLQDSVTTVTSAPHPPQYHLRSASINP